MSSIGHQLRVRQVAAFLEANGPEPGEPYPCPYLPERSARNIGFRVPQESPGLYHILMDLNFRRSGIVYYRPACDGCRECRAIRVPVNEFVPSRTHKRCLQRNSDVRVSVASPTVTAEKIELYGTYLAQRHDGQMEGSEDEYTRFLCESSVETQEASFRDESGRLLGVAIFDLEPSAMSAVYCFFDPSEQNQRRSLGVFNVLWSIEECLRRGLVHLYLGYLVEGNPRMAYKRQYRPHEVLAVTEGPGPYEWARVPFGPGAS